MNDKRSRSYAGGGGMQIEPYGARAPPPTTSDPRSYSTSHASFSQKEMKLKKVKSGSSFKGGWFNDPEFQRRKRVSGYKAYSVEGKVKGSLRNSIRWLKNKYYQVVYGWW